MHILHYITGLPGLYWYNIHIAAHYTCQYMYVYARTKKHIYIYIYTTTHVFSSKHRWERETWSHLQQAIQLNLPQHPQIRCTKCQFFCGDTKLAHRWIKVSIFLPAWVIQLHTRLNEIWIFDGYLIFWICVRGELSCSKSSGPRGSSWENGGGDIGAITSHHRATRCSFPSRGWNKKHVRNWIRCHSSKQKNLLGQKL